MVLLFLKLKPIIKRTNTARSHCHCWLWWYCYRCWHMHFAWCWFFFEFLLFSRIHANSAIILVWGDINIDFCHTCWLFRSSKCTTLTHSLYMKLVYVRTFILYYHLSIRNTNHNKNSAFQIELRKHECVRVRDILFGPLVSTHRNFVKINCILVKSHSNWIEI